VNDGAKVAVVCGVVLSVSSFWSGWLGVRWGATRELDRITRAQLDLDNYVDLKMAKLREERDQ
jgi:hypothetical protein